MKIVPCAGCRQAFPMQDTVLIDDKPLCGSCAEVHLESRADDRPEEDGVYHQTDPTICGYCGSDAGDDELPIVADQPACAICERKLTKRPHPLWLKLGFLPLVTWAAFSWFSDERYMAAYLDLLYTERAVEERRVDQAAIFMQAAAARVPESRDLADLLALYRRMSPLGGDQCADALKAFRTTRSHGKRNRLIGELLLSAEVGAAFDLGNHDEILSRMQILAARSPFDGWVSAGVASAYTCKYVSTGSKQDRQEAMRWLGRLGRIGNTDDADLVEYGVRIHHRLDTRQIVSRSEFRRRFPHGYRRGIRL